MKNQLISQNVALCIVQRTHSIIFNKDFEQKTAVLAAGFLDLIQQGYVKENAKNELEPTASAMPLEPHLAALFANMQSQKPKSLKKWLDTYINGFSSKPCKQYANKLTYFIEQLGVVSAAGEKGLLIKTDNYIVQQQELDKLATLVEKAVTDAPLTYDEQATIVCMCVAKLVRVVSSKENEKLLVRKVKKDPQFKTMRTVADEIYVIMTILAGSQALR